MAGTSFATRSTTGQSSASKRIPTAPQFVARYASSLAVDRQETLTAAAPMRAAPPWPMMNSGRFFIMKRRLAPRPSPRRPSAPANRSILPSTSANVSASSCQ
jgi:hypothetical protein